MMKELIRYAGTNGAREVVVGMAHRGRLNMLVNVLGKKNRRTCLMSLRVSMVNLGEPVM